MARCISYKQAISLAIGNHDDMVLYLEEIVMNHKNWGHFKVKLDSATITLLVDTIKRLAEQQAGDLMPIEVDECDLKE